MQKGYFIKIKKFKIYIIIIIKNRKKNFLILL